jgi:hypothetical protein
LRGGPGLRRLLPEPGGKPPPKDPKKKEEEPSAAELERIERERREKVGERKKAPQ